MLSIRTLLLVGVIAYVISVIILFPLGKYQNNIRQSLSPAIDIQQFQGTLWQTDIAYQAAKLPDSVRFGKMAAGFSLKPLLWLHLGGQLEVLHSGLKLSGVVSKGLNSVALNDGRGTIEARFINPLIEQHGVQIVGELLLDDIRIKLDPETRAVHFAEGAIEYAGGQAVVKQGSRRQKIKVPSMSGRFSSFEGGLRLEVRQAGSEQVLANITLQQDGWAELAILKGFFKAIGQAGVISDINIKERIF